MLRVVHFLDNDLQDFSTVFPEHPFGIVSSFLVFPLDPTEIERLYGGPAEVTAITGVFRFRWLFELQPELFCPENGIFVIYEGNELERLQQIVTSYSVNLL